MLQAIPAEQDVKDLDCRSLDHPIALAILYTRYTKLYERLAIASALWHTIKQVEKPYVFSNSELNKSAGHEGWQDILAGS